MARSLVGLHATDPPTVFLAAAARLRTPTVAAIERAMYDERTLVRMLGMRRTMFVVPVELVPEVQAACTDALVAGERRRLVAMLEDSAITRDGERWLAAVEAETLAAIEARGEVTGAELSRALPNLRKRIPYGEGKKWQGTMGVSSRVLYLLSCEQRIVRGRPTGGWTSSQYRWSPMRAWLRDDVPPMTPAQARAGLLRRWLATFGPATITDIAWWTGWTRAQVAEALVAVGATEVALDEGGAGVVLADDIAPVRAPTRAPWVALLPSLDPTVMGWKERGWYLGEHGAALFDRSGNAGPTVWCDGRIIGGWAQRRDGRVVHRLLETVGRETEAAVEVEVERLTDWLGDVRITSRFPAPLQQELLR